MLSEQINRLLETLGASVSDIGAYSDMGVTNISRLKSGARTPKPTGSTTQKLLDGVLLYCREKEKTPALDALIGFTGGDRREALRSWLFPAEDESAVNMASFPGRMHAVMSLTGTSNKELASHINLDPSYVSRLRKGTRILKANSALYEAISHALFAIALSKNLLEPLKKLIGYTGDGDDEALYYSFKRWLCDFQPEVEHIKSLLQSIDAVQPLAALPFAVPEEALSYTERAYYTGDSGLQEAAIRFLQEVICSDAPSIFLYSDRSIEWMTQDPVFRAKWGTLMFRLVSKGIKIRIIHNIDRKVDEMVNAVRSWLPLYMSCCIEPYYTNVQAGKRFTHTLFVCPGVACVTALNSYGGGETLFRYDTEAPLILHAQQVFNHLLDNSLPLVHMQKRSESLSATAYKQPSEFSNVEIAIDAVSVTVTRTAPPEVSFVVLNDALCNAVRAYCTNVYNRLDKADEDEQKNP